MRRWRKHPGLRRVIRIADGVDLNHPAEAAEGYGLSSLPFDEPTS